MRWTAGLVAVTSRPALPGAAGAAFPYQPQGAPGDYSEYLAVADARVRRSPRAVRAPRWFA